MSVDGRYYELVLQHWENIVRLYVMFEDKRPVMLYDVQDQKIYAYPCDEYKKELSPRSQKMLTKQYRQALDQDKIVVFVRDNEKKKLVSYSETNSIPRRKHVYYLQPLFSFSATGYRGSDSGKTYQTLFESLCHQLRLFRRENQQ